MSDGQLVRIENDGELILSKRGREVFVNDPAVTMDLSLFSDGSCR